MGPWGSLNIHLPLGGMAAPNGGVKIIQASLRGKRTKFVTFCFFIPSLIQLLFYCIYFFRVVYDIKFTY